MIPPAARHASAPAAGSVFGPYFVACAQTAEIWRASMALPAGSERFAVRMPPTVQPQRGGHASVRSMSFGLFDVPAKKGPTLCFAQGRSNSPATSKGFESLAQLKRVLPGGTVTAGNARPAKRRRTRPVWSLPKIT